MDCVSCSFLLRQLCLAPWPSSAPKHEGTAAQLQSVESVACLVDSYLSKMSRYGNLALGKFQAMAELLPELARVCHDGLYRAVVPESASGGDGARAEAAMPSGGLQGCERNCRSVAGGAHARGTTSGCCSTSRCANAAVGGGKDGRRLARSARWARRTTSTC